MDDRLTIQPPLAASSVFGAAQVLRNSPDADFTLAAGDLDRDGDIDLVSGSMIGGAHSWYENAGGGAITQRALGTVGDDIKTTLLADLDGNGDPDVITGRTLGESLGLRTSAARFSRSAQLPRAPSRTMR